MGNALNADLVANNGVIHVLDRLLEPATPCPHPELECEPGQVCRDGCALSHSTQEPLSELDEGDIRTISILIDAAQLGDEFRHGMITIFAPSDASINALELAEPGTVAALLEDREALTHLLRFHMVPSELTAHDYSRSTVC